MHFIFDAAILSRMRFPVTSRSNWAKESEIFKVDRPMEEGVLDCRVTGMKDIPLLVEELYDLGKVGHGAS